MLRGCWEEGEPTTTAILVLEMKFETREAGNLDLF